MSSALDADAIVIGAGAAGLTAARSLAARSLRVIMLEARDRVGGRVWSHPLERPAVAAELGAEFIHGPAEETRALLRNAGTAAVDLCGDSWTCNEDGDLQREEDNLLSAPDIFEGACALASDESVDRFLRRFEEDKAKRETVRAARAFVEGFEAADPAIASARAIADEWRSGVDFTIARPLGGYRSMFELLRKACATAGVQSYLSTVVRRISWRRGAVAVDIKNSWGAQTIHARAAIVTLPVGVLRHNADETEVVFDPKLPAQKHEALQSIEMGHAVRVGLWFRTAFWERIRDGCYRDSAFFRCVGKPFSAYWTQLPVRSELIVAWAGGPKATAFNGASQEQIIGRALRGFGEMFGEPTLADKEFEGAVFHDWGHDPFARGAYSYIGVGGGDARAKLAAPIDDALFFAGEATSTDGQGGTVNGALKTGERAAREAATSLGAKV